MKYALLFSLLLLLISCSQNDTNDQEEVIVCTEVFVYGLNVQVKDAATGGIIPQGITVTIQDGNYMEELAFSFDTYFGAGERAGNYTITATGEGYMTKTVGPIEVTADECHVLPVLVRINLETN